MLSLSKLCDGDSPGLVTSIGIGISKSTENIGKPD